MNNQPIDWSSPQRQSPAALFIILLKVAKGMLRIIWPLLIFYFVKERRGSIDNMELIIAAIPVIVLLRALLEYMSFRFYIAGDDFVIRKGILQKQTITIPLEKIQAVHVEQTFLHGLLGTARIAFDSAGTEKIEVKIDAVVLARAQELKSFILRSGLVHQDEGEAAMPEENLVTLGWKDLVKLSISSNHIEAFFILLGFLFSVLDNVKDLLNTQLSNLFYETSDFFIRSTSSMVLALVLFSLIISVVVSTGRTFLSYYNFYINRNENGFRISSGLLHVKEKVLPFKKVQYISWRANWLRRKMGLSLLQFHSVGGNEMKQRQQVKVPLTRYSFIEKVTFPYQSLHTAQKGSVHRMHPSYAFRRMVLPGVPLGILPAAVTWIWVQWYALLFLLVLPYLYFSAVVAVRRFRLCLAEDSLFIHKGIFGTEEVLLKWQMIQKISLNQSIYQRGHQLATVRLHTAGGVITVPFIELALARRICDYALYRAEVQVWM